MIKLYESYAWMHRQYIVKAQSEEEIAEKAGVDQATINRWLHKHKLKRTK